MLSVSPNKFNWESICLCLYIFFTMKLKVLGCVSLNYSFIVDIYFLKYCLLSYNSCKNHFVYVVLKNAKVCCQHTLNPGKLFL